MLPFFLSTISLFSKDYLEKVLVLPASDTAPDERLLVRPALLKTSDWSTSLAIEKSTSTGKLSRT
jgi:hypothetical protein